MVVFKAYAAHKTEGNINTKCAWCEKRHVYRRHVWWSLVPEYERCRYTWTSLNQIQLRLCERVPFLSFTQPLHTSALRLIWDTWQVVSFLSSFHFTSSQSRTLYVWSMCAAARINWEMRAFKRLLLRSDGVKDEEDKVPRIPPCWSTPSLLWYSLCSVLLVTSERHLNSSFKTVRTSHHSKTESNKEIPFHTNGHQSALWKITLTSKNVWKLSLLPSTGLFSFNSRISKSGGSMERYHQPYYQSIFNTQISVMTAAMISKGNM